MIFPIFSLQKMILSRHLRSRKHRKFVIFAEIKKQKYESKNHGSHPSLVIGQTDDGSSYVNIGLTNELKRGHHKNIKIHNSQNWEKQSYLRDDVRIDPKKYLSEILKDDKLCPDDIDKIWAIIKKKNSH